MPPTGTLPEVMRTPEIIGSGNKMPKNENVSEPAVAGTKNVPSDLFALPKRVIDVVFAKSTSLNTAPKPWVKAGVSVPGIKKFTSKVLLPREVKSRCGLKVSKVAE